MKKWIFSEDLPREADPNSFAQKLKIPPLIARILLRRGLTDEESARRFLFPELKDLSQPLLWQGMKEAVDVLEKGIEAQKTVFIWGDYDVDGITASALADEVLKFHGVRTRVYLPDRRRNGYGLNISGLEELAKEGPGVLLTVDCGISDADAVKRARELGFDVVVTDHHMPPEQLPESDGIVNPRIGNNPSADLCGVGMAFFVLGELNRRLTLKNGRRFPMRQVLDLVALGTLADMVSLTGQNRILVRHGMDGIRDADRVGIEKLKDVSGFSAHQALKAGQIVFQLGPRINASGRMGSPEKAFRLLQREIDPEEADSLAKELNVLNQQRREEEQRIFREALEQAEAFRDSAALVLCGKDWHPGVIGIVASNILEKYVRPVIILTADGDDLKGSGRSIPEFDLYAGLKACSELLLACGGHRQAAGLRLRSENLEAFRKLFAEEVSSRLGGVAPEPCLHIEETISLQEASDISIVRSLELLQPYGIGNSEPVFASEPLIVEQMRRVGKKCEHLIMKVRAGNRVCSAKLWGRADEFSSDLLGASVRLAFAPEVNIFRNPESVDLIVKDIHNC
ncbi:MAG: single-stranded-DNA-specific exonuclease RecJ [Desulfovibrionaceae bacterium]|nr:single-stranded-DNA-specific exonuclease RecJ [Desulfovibrionaceae bacterium]